MNTKQTAHPALNPGGEGPRRRGHRGIEEREHWVRLQERSGRTLKTFCEENGLAVSTLSLWRRQVRGPAAERRDRGALIEVPLRRPFKSGAAMVSVVTGPATMIHLPDGTSVEVATNTDTVWLGRLLVTLGRAKPAG